MVFRAMLAVGRWGTYAALALAIALTLGGCVGPMVVVMRDPASGQTFMCGAGDGTNAMAPVIASRVARDCAQGLQASGWERMN